MHKATHHFDLINWWLDADPVEVSAFGSLNTYGRKGPFRHTNCRPCPHKGAVLVLLGHRPSSADLMALYADCEKADGYLRDGCVFKEDVNIADTMNAVVRYSSGVTMSYSLNTFMPIEGYRLAFNGTKGRLEVRDFERQPWEPGEETEIHVIKNFGQRVEDRDSEGRGRPRRGRRPAARPDLPQRRGARVHSSAGLARGGHVVPHRDRGSQERGQGRPVKIADLVRL